jgi:hypothetical protein
MEVGGKITQIVDSAGHKVYFNYEQASVGGKHPEAHLHFEALQCLSFTNTCEDPQKLLLSFEMHIIVAFLRPKVSMDLAGQPQAANPSQVEFDLRRVLDPKGHGPTYDYYYGAQGDQTEYTREFSDYLPDAHLELACHAMFDAKSSNCHNLDLCSVAIEDQITATCGPIADLKPGKSKTEVIDGKLVTYNLPVPDFSACLDYCVASGGLAWHTGDEWSAIQKECTRLAQNSEVSCDNGNWKKLGYPSEEYCQAKYYPDYGTHRCQSWADECFSKAYLAAGGPNAVSNCRIAMYNQCVSQKGAKDSSGRRRYAYGVPPELYHNLIGVTDADGRLLVQNTYGQDPFSPNFDKVIKHVQGSGPDNVMTFEYHDLKLEQLPLLGSPTNPQYVTSLPTFKSVEVCPRTCNAYDANSQCIEWGRSYENENTAKGPTSVQMPAYAVVVFDTGGIVRTNYYDSS